MKTLLASRQSYEFPFFDRALHRSAQGANEFLAALVHEVDRRRPTGFTSDDVADWLSGRYSRGYVQRMLWRLRKRGFLHASRCARVVTCGLRRGYRNLYQVTKRGRERAEWELRSHNLASIAFLACPAENIGFASAVRLHALSTASDGLLTFRSRQRNSLGLLLWALSRKSAYAFSFSGEFADLWWWVKLLKAEGVVPGNLAPAGWLLSAQKFFGLTKEQILIATLYHAARVHKRRVEMLQENLESTNRLQFVNELSQARYEILLKRCESREQLISQLFDLLHKCLDVMK